MVEHEHIRLDILHVIQHGRRGGDTTLIRMDDDIGQAIVHRPALVVMDEPISGLDPAQIVEMRALVRSLAGKHTVIVSSHILSEISETCDRILVLRDGRVVASGSEQELSSQLLQGMRVDVTVRKPGESDVAADARTALGRVSGVDQVDVMDRMDMADIAENIGLSSFGSCP